MRNKWVAVDPHHWAICPPPPLSSLCPTHAKEPPDPHNQAPPPPQATTVSKGEKRKVELVSERTPSVSGSSTCRTRAPASSSITPGSTTTHSRSQQAAGVGPDLEADLDPDPPPPPRRCEVPASYMHTLTHGQRPGSNIHRSMPMRTRAGHGCCPSVCHVCTRLEPPACLHAC